MQETVFWDLAPCIPKIHGARTQKTVSSIVITMKTSNLTFLVKFSIFHYILRTFTNAFMRIKSHKNGQLLPHRAVAFYARIYSSRPHIIQDKF
jgi:hypothetical protein